MQTGGTPLGLAAANGHTLVFKSPLTGHFLFPNSHDFRGFAGIFSFQSGAVNALLKAGAWLEAKTDVRSVREFLMVSLMVSLAH